MAVFYPAGYGGSFHGKSLQEVREIAFEIGMLGQHAQDVNDPKEPLAQS